MARSASWSAAVSNEQTSQDSKAKEKGEPYEKIRLRFQEKRPYGSRSKKRRRTTEQEKRELKRGA